MSSKWYVSWFDSEYYHLLYDNRDEEEAKLFMRSMCEYLKMPQGARVLDAACGRGRHSRYLAELGFRVDGFDLSENSIDYAKEFENKQLHFYVHNLKEVFRENYYDYVFNLFTSFGYFEDSDDDYLVFSNLCKNLKPEGTLVIDFLNPNYVKSNLNTEVVETQKESVVYQTQKELKAGAVLKHIKFYDRDSAQEGEFTERVKLLELSDFKNFAEAADIKLAQVFGSYTLDPYDVEHSERMVMVFRK